MINWISLRLGMDFYLRNGEKPSALLFKHWKWSKVIFCLSLLFFGWKIEAEQKSWQHFLYVSSVRWCGLFHLTFHLSVKKIHWNCLLIDGPMGKKFLFSFYRKKEIVRFHAIINNDGIHFQHQCAGMIKLAIYLKSSCFLSQNKQYQQPFLIWIFVFKNNFWPFIDKNRNITMNKWIFGWTHKSWNTIHQT